MTVSQPRVSVVIPTFNGRRYLPLVLAALARQTLNASDFEIIVVDNNSTVELLDSPPAAEALAELDQRGISFQCVRELRQGLTYGRARGVAESRAEFVCFLDDDNEPVTTYLESGVTAISDPSVGLLVSRVYPAYEQEPSAAVRRREHLLAINYKLGDAPIRWSRECELCPTLGAGLWVRKDAFLRASGLLNQALTDRCGDSLVSGGDIELGIAVGRLGLDRLYVPELVLNHHIPKSRIQTSYFLRLISGIVRSQATIDARLLNIENGAIKRLGELLACVSFGWLRAIARGDARREYIFMVAAAFARWQGPFPNAAAYTTDVPTSRSDGTGKSSGQIPAWTDQTRSNSPIIR